MIKVQRLSFEDDIYFVIAERDTKVFQLKGLGLSHFACLRYCIDDQGPCIAELGVDERFRGNGYAQILIQECIKYARDCREKYILVQDNSDNWKDPENNIYIKCGFYGEKIKFINL